MPQTPLTPLSEEELLWIGGFADTLRALEPALAADGCGEEADRLARQAFEQPALRAQPPQRAAQRWWEQHTKPG